MSFSIEKTLPFISQTEIKNICQRLGQHISIDYKGKDLVCLVILKGSFVFAADLIRNIKVPMSVEFVQLTSYGHGTQSSGVVKIVKDVTTDIKNKDVLVIEDILDTGTTLNAFTKHLKSHTPRSVSICTLLDKPARRVAAIQAQYVGKTIEDKFVVGYGLDYAELYRNLPEIRYFPT